MGVSRPFEPRLGAVVAASSTGGADRRTGVEDGPRPTERKTACENVVRATVAEPLPPPPEPPSREPCAWRKVSRARRSDALAVVASERTGNPIVTQRSATSGRARSTGKARERVRAILRAEGSRRGRST
jgi:hypothetical protein